VTTEYGVGPLRSGPHVHVLETVSSTITDLQIDAWLQGRLDGTHPEWPAPDGSTIYALYYPPGVTINSTYIGSPSCVGWHGYHFDTKLPNGTQVPYAVISRCDGLPEDPTIHGIQYISAVASHELVEGLTDTFVATSTPAYGQTDNDHIVWSFFTAELGDMCALWGDVFFTPSDFSPYKVQRIWSNAAAKQGLDPCVPALTGDEPYFNSYPVLADSISLSVQGMRFPTKGVSIPVGGTKTIEVDLASAGPTSGPWEVMAVEYQSQTAPAHLQLTLDKTSGSNGDKLQLTIKVLQVNADYGAEPFVLVSRLGTRRSLFFGLVGN
jgi:hypothetical protein